MQLIVEQKGFNIVPLRGVPVCVNPVRVHLPRKNCSGVCAYSCTPASDLESGEQMKSEPRK